MFIAFDLDGTISDPFEGITKSINYALDKLGLDVVPQDKLKQYIGPSLQTAFSDLLDDHNKVGVAIDYYLERYSDIGYQENILYEGIITLLERLRENGYKLFIATSKRQEIAIKVLKHFQIDHFFDDILGCGLTRKKHELLLQIKNENKADRLFMVGDRYFDIEAAKQADCEGIGVLWGYGSKKELLDSGAISLIERPHHLLDII